MSTVVSESVKSALPQSKATLTTNIFSSSFYLKKIISLILVLVMLMSCPTDALANSTTINVTQNAERIENNNHEGESIFTFIAGTIIGAVSGGVSSIVLVANAGMVEGLSAAGITSGLDAVGLIVGGGIAAGLAVAAALPVIVIGTVAIGGATVYAAKVVLESFNPQESPNTSKISGSNGS